MIVTKLVATPLTMVFLMAASSVFAGEKLDDAKIKALITGKTVHGENTKRNTKFMIYFDKDGKTAIRKGPKKTRTAQYSIKNNMQCFQRKKKERCASIQDNGDGTYSRINNKGKSIVKWTKVEDGKKF